MAPALFPATGSDSEGSDEGDIAPVVEDSDLKSSDLTLSSSISARLRAPYEKAEKPMFGSGDAELSNFHCRDGSDDDEPPLWSASSLTSLAGHSFAYSEVFAGTSALGEWFGVFGGVPQSFIEIDPTDLRLLEHFHPEALRAADFYDRHWDTWSVQADVLFGWPMCRHISVAGLQKMQHDVVASQLWDLAEVAVKQSAKMVVIENPERLEELDHVHGLLATAVQAFEVSGYTLSAVVPLQDNFLNGQTTRRRIFLFFELIELELRLPLLVRDRLSLSWSPFELSLDPPSAVASMVLRGTLRFDDAWNGSVHRVGWFTFSAVRPLQPGTSFRVVGEDGWWCVFSDDGELVRVRSMDRKCPRFMHVAFSRVGSFGSTLVLGSDGTVGTLRSSPDPPGNCLFLDQNVGPTAVRSLTKAEEWRVSGRCPEKLMWLEEFAPSQIPHKAGKAITGPMAHALSELTALRLLCISAVLHPVFPCLSVDVKSWRAPLWFAVICRSTGCVLATPCHSLLPGLFLECSREAAIDLALAFVRRLLGADTECEPFLAGEALGQGPLALIMACPVLDSWDLRLGDSTLGWHKIDCLTNSQCKLLVSTALLRVQMLCGPTELSSVPPCFRSGVTEVKMVKHLARVDPSSWTAHCEAAEIAMRMLRSAYDSAILAEADRVVAISLAQWKDRIAPFCAADTPPDLRGRIPFPEYSDEPFPVPHLPPVTEWLPLKPPQAEVRHWVESVSEIFTQPAWGQIVTFLLLLTAWMDDPTNNPRPRPVAIGQGGLQPWAQGGILDLRKLVNGKGWVTQLDFEARTPTQFKIDFIRVRLSNYPDQELVSHLVLGVRMHAEIDLQLVLLPHLLSLEGMEEVVLADLLLLTHPPYEWVGFFESLPFVPGRYIGKGVVPKAGDQIRPIDEAGGPRTLLLDSDGFYVWALNATIEGREDWDNYSAELVFLKKKASKLPKESKPTAKHVRTVVRILRAAARAAGMPLLGFLSDLEKYFNQFMLAPEEYWKSNSAWSHSRFTSNYCMTFGITSASNIAQRAGNALVWVFLQDFAEFDAPFVAADAASSPDLAEWLRLRRLLGPGQDSLLFMLIYTDDPIWLVVGADRLVRAQKMWLCLLMKFGLRSASLSKQVAGIDLLWCGIRHHLFFGLTIIPPDKALKAIGGLNRMLGGCCPSQQGRSCLGLLEFCRYAVAVRDLRLYPLWCALMDEPAALMTLDVLQSALAARWTSLLGTCSGSAVTESFDGVDLLPASAPIWTLSSDAALEPLDQAGMGGFVHGLWWRVPREDGLEALTIPVAELLAAGVSLEVLFDLLGAPDHGAPEFWLRWEIDALAGVFVLANDSAKSEVMRFTLDCIQASKAYKYFLPVLILCHLYGVINIASDAASRGLIDKLVALTRSFGGTLQEVQLPAAAMDLIDMVVAKAEEVLSPGGSPGVPSVRLLSKVEMALDITAANTPTSASFLKVLIPVRNHGRDTSSLVTVGVVKPGLVPARGSASVQPSTMRLEKGTSLLGGVTPPRVLLPVRAPVETTLPPQAPASPDAPTRARAALLAEHLSGDLSKYALCRDQPDRLQAMCLTVDGLMANSFAASTEKRDALGWKRWCAYCRSLGTTPWRDDPAAVTGADSVAYRREVVLCVNFVVECHKTIRPRPNGSGRTRCKPESAMNVLREVRRVFKRAMVPLMPLTSVTQALKGILRNFLKDFGQAALTPKRAAPFTNELLRSMFALEGTLRVNSASSVEWSSFLGLNLQATLALATCTGMRKSELVSDGSTFALTRGSVAFLIGGRLYGSPTLAQLLALTDKDFLVIIPPPSKSDQFGVVWGSLPIYVPVRHIPGNAALLVARILAQQPSMPAAAPLLCSAPGKPFTHYFLVVALRAWLAACGVPPQQLGFMTWHSARVYLACALLAAGRSPETIQALLRWQTVDSLRIYACLSAGAYAAHLDAARGASIAAIRGAHIPLVDSIDLAFNIQQSLGQA
jgi:hypothetical protein